ncbi:MAG: CsgG/HfaB family protein [Nitrospirae bacterium]|nr:CsgG/HfaB family protein [Nitrospirota bacterium]
MKNRLFKFTVLMALCGVLSVVTGCASFMEYGKLEKSARESYEAKNYDTAVFTVVKSLKLDPTYDKSQALIKEAYPKAVDVHESRIQELSAGSAKFKWDEVVQEYNALTSIHQAIKSLPPLAEGKTKETIKFDLKNYSDNFAKAKSSAAEAHYQEGLRLSKNDEVDVQKQAAKEFKAAGQFVAGYKDAQELYEKCRKSGIKRIAIIPFEDKSGKGGKYGAVAETVLDQIVSDVMNDQSAMEFLEVISRDQMEQVMQEQKLGMTGLLDEQTAVKVGKILGVHEILTGKITSIAYTPERTTQKNVREKESVVVGEQKYTDNKGREQTKNIYGDVFATVTIYSRSAGASIAGSYKLIEVKTAKLKKSDSFIGKEDFSCEWAAFTGDEKALSSSSSALARKSEMVAPSEEEMVSKAEKNLSLSLASALKTYAR